MADASSHFRRAPRKPVALRVRYRRHRAGGSAFEQDGVTDDLSLGGAFVQVDSPPPIGARVVLTIASPVTWEPFEVVGDVRRVSDGTDGKPKGFGVRFRAVKGEAARALYELVHTDTYGEEAPR